MIRSRSFSGSIFALWAALLFLPSCSSRIAYRPREDMVQVLGLEGAKALLTSTLLGSQRVGACRWSTSRHRVISVEFRGDVVIVHGQQSQASPGLAGAPWYQPVPLRSLERVDLLSNHWAHVYISPDTCVLRVLFASEEESMTFADLMLSFRAEPPDSR